MSSCEAGMLDSNDRYSLFTRKNIDAYEMDFGVTVFTSLRGRHFDDLARASLQHDEAVLAQSRALHGEGGGRARVDGLEVCILHGIGHCS